MILWIKTFFGILFQTLLLGVFLFLPGLTLNWPDAFLFLSIHFSITILASSYLLIFKPASIEARMNYDSEAQPKEDRLATALMFSAIIFGLSLAPIDIFHLNLSPVFETVTKNIGLVIYILGMLLVMASMNANEFAETTVNIQETRGQKVVDTGIYSLVRHPMYTGFIFFITGVNIWLGTYLSLLLSLTFLVIALRSRINIEEKTLLNDLEGYEDYCKKVKARLIPYLF
jgi:protein-S-isoprenylcysteine O-methyltransferase Ste14